MKQKKNHNTYIPPQAREIMICTEGVLCSSDNNDFTANSIENFSWNDFAW